MKKAPCLLIIFSVFLRLWFIFSTELLPEETYYWQYALHLDYAYLDHPGMVAWLIKGSSLLFGVHEWSIRLPAFFCWLITLFFAHKLTEQVKKGAGLYAVLLLSILPFFFVQSMVITPDAPLLACWAAALYCCYRALIRVEAKYWYGAGVSLGLGMLSKYTIACFGPSILLFVMLIPHARQWFYRKEPYLALLIAMILFSPVLYWNMQHDWVSFAFQSTRRFQDPIETSAHIYIGLLLLFLTPTGVLAIWTLYKQNKTAPFIIYFAYLPLLLIGLFSITHVVKFNWLGPPMLALIPWFAASIIDGDKWFKINFYQGWLISSLTFLSIYALLINCLSTGQPENIYRFLLNKFISWKAFAEQVTQIAAEVEQQTKQQPVIVPLELYNMMSELSYYQQSHPYPVMACHVFGGVSLMYRYWYPNAKVSGKTVILLATTPANFNNPDILDMVNQRSDIRHFWGQAPKTGYPLRQYFYQVVKVN